MSKPLDDDLQEFNDSLAAGGERLCNSCGDCKPLTVQFWNRDAHHHSGFKSICRLCRNAQRKEEKQKIALSKTTALTQMARTAILVQKDGKYSADLTELIDIGLELWNGKQGFMERWIEEFESAAEGGMIRCKYLTEFARLFAKASEKVPERSAKTMTDEELQASLSKFIGALEEQRAAVPGDDDEDAV